MSFHTIVITGNLGGDPEMRYTPSGQAVTNFNVAVNESFTNSNGERIKRTIWFRVSAWGRQAETCNQYLKKGRMVLVEGRVTADPNTGGPRVWTGQDGSPRASFEISAQTVRFLSSRGEYDSGGGGGGGQMDAGDMLPPEDDIPF
jgi:single-strand DNA-binding protein